MQKYDQSLNDLWNSIKHFTICIIKITRGKDRENEMEKVSEKTYAENSLEPQAGNIIRKIHVGTL